jgi:hypothetical protein
MRERDARSLGETFGNPGGSGGGPGRSSTWVCQVVVRGQGGLLPCRLVLFVLWVC